MATKKAEIRLLFTNGKEMAVTVEYEEGDKRLSPIYYLGGSENDDGSVEDKVIRVGNRAYRTKYIILAEIIEEAGGSEGPYL